ncbi:MAG TPA: hypothetical protein VKA21_15320 [Candidatus Binatia bacterium]|nr:hypothetical protein [Candidatus Binatia bacterium]
MDRRRSFLAALLVNVTVLLAGPATASAQTGICGYDCPRAWAKCLGEAGCHYIPCPDGDRCNGTHCTRGGVCGRSPAACGQACDLGLASCRQSCPETYLRAVPRALAELDLPDKVARQLLEPIGEADRALEKALSGAAPVVGKEMSAFREEIRRRAGKDIPKAEALRLERLALEIEATLAGDGLRQSVARLLERAERECAASPRTVRTKREPAKD